MSRQDRAAGTTALSVSLALLALTSGVLVVAQASALARIPAGGMGPGGTLGLTSLAEVPARGSVTSGARADTALSPGVVATLPVGLYPD